MPVPGYRFFATAVFALLTEDCSSGSTPSAVDPSTSAPAPAAHDVILWQDDFNKPSLSALVAPYATRGEQLLAADGRTGTAIRFPYSDSSYDNLIEREFDATPDVYFRFWYRTSPGADPSCAGRNDSGIKWFMAWRRDGEPRYTMSATNADGAPYQGRANAGLEFTSHDNSSVRQPAQMLSNIDHGVRLSTTNDGRWHEYTLHIRTGDEGYEQIWVDGVRVLDSHGLGYDHSAVGISMFQMPGAMVRWFPGCDFHIDIDDLVVWRR